jgi:hypothetical protein
VLGIAGKIAAGLFGIPLFSRRERPGSQADPRMGNNIVFITNIFPVKAYLNQTFLPTEEIVVQVKNK